MFKKEKLSRVVILGANSFIGKAIVKKFKNRNIKSVLLTRKEVDLEKKQSTKKLKQILKKGDTVIFIAAVAPVKNIEMLNQNLIICKNIVETLKIKKPNHLVYISSDAVYSDSRKKINEKSETTPGSFHGFMHLIRENMLNELDCLKCFIRPTLVFGSSDPHNGYGPNKFIRCAQKNEQIILFGKGEEQRDHIHVDNVAEIVFGSVIKKISGIINAVSGNVISFNEISKNLKKIYPNLIVKTSKRNGPMPHNGYRVFDNKLLRKKFPDIAIIKLSDWIKKKELYKI
ncbi:SDR family oxidoreductase [Candidatus Pelagibacter sp.]|nr:SDR family oxidoreductase [Candidatus Pelagibacter sp.]